MMNFLTRAITEREGQHQSRRESQLSKSASHMAMQGRVNTRVVARPGVVLTSEGVGGEGALKEGESPEDQAGDTPRECYQTPGCQH